MSARSNESVKRARLLLEFIRQYQLMHGYPPTYEEMREAVGWKSKNTVHCHLSRLRWMNVVDYRDRSPRTIRITGSLEDAS
jgi:SOS-response transcriptional repressor LexA